MNSKILTKEDYDNINNLCNKLEKSVYDFGNSMPLEQKIEKLSNNITSLDKFETRLIVSSNKKQNICDSFRFVQGASASFMIIFGILSLLSNPWLFFSLAIASLFVTSYSFYKAITTYRSTENDLDLLDVVTKLKTKSAQLYSILNPENENDEENKEELDNKEVKNQNIKKSQINSTLNKNTSTKKEVNNDENENLFQR